MRLVLIAVSGFVTGFVVVFCLCLALHHLRDRKLRKSVERAMALDRESR